MFDSLFPLHIQKRRGDLKYSKRKQNQNTKKQKDSFLGGKGDDRGWDRWMASSTWWTWGCVNSGSWCWTGRPGMLQFMGSQRIGHDWATELALNKMLGTLWIFSIYSQYLLLLLLCHNIERIFSYNLRICLSKQSSFFAPLLLSSHEETGEVGDSLLPCGPHFNIV